VTYIVECTPLYARISQILHLFQLYQTPHLIVASFGTGVFKNRIDLIATLFADLLIWEVQERADHTEYFQGCLMCYSMRVIQTKWYLIAG
jgi:hypothetical protein